MGTLFWAQKGYTLQHDKYELSVTSMGVGVCQVQGENTGLIFSQFSPLSIEQPCCVVVILAVGTEVKGFCMCWSGVTFSSSVCIGLVVMAHALGGLLVAAARTTACWMNIDDASRVFPEVTYI
jgi:hypothetical protein